MEQAESRRSNDAPLLVTSPPPARGTRWQVANFVVAALFSKELHRRGAPNVLWIRIELFNAEFISSFLVPHIAALTSGLVGSLLNQDAARNLEATLDKIGVSPALPRFGIVGGSDVPRFQQERDP